KPAPPGAGVRRRFRLKGHRSLESERGIFKGVSDRESGLRRGDPAKRSMAAAGAVAVTVLTWSAAFPVIGVGLEGFGPAPLAALRFAIAASAVFVWIGLARPKRPSPADAPSFLLCGLLGIALYNLFLNTGQQTVAAGAAS